MGQQWRNVVIVQVIEQIVWWKRWRKIHEHVGEHKKINFVIIEHKHGYNHNQMSQQW